MTSTWRSRNQGVCRWAAPSETRRKPHSSTPCNPAAPYLHFDGEPGSGLGLAIAKRPAGARRRRPHPCPGAPRHPARPHHGPRHPVPRRPQPDLHRRRSPAPRGGRRLPRTARLAPRGGSRHVPRFHRVGPGRTDGRRCRRAAGPPRRTAWSSPRSCLAFSATPRSVRRMPSRFPPGRPQVPQHHRAVLITYRAGWCPVPGTHGAAPQPQWPKTCLSTRGQGVRHRSG